MTQFDEHSLINWMSWRWLFAGLIGWAVVSLYLLNVFMPTPTFLVGDGLYFIL
jgi:hypothetical protein